MASQSDADSGASLAAAAYQRTLLGRIDARLFSFPHARAVLTAAIAVILVVPAVQFVHRIQQLDESAFRAGGVRHKTALGRWIADAEALSRNDPRESPYGFGHWFPTPPFVLMTLVPLSKLGYSGAAVVWATAKIAGLLAACILLVRALDGRGSAVPTGVLVATALFSLRPLIADLQHGNLNIFLVIWLALAWAAYLGGRDAAAGLFLSLAIVTKVTPALALLYFAYRRNWRICAFAAVGLLLVFILIPGAVLGFGRNAALLREWFQMLVAPFALQGYAAGEIANQSLYGVVVRMLDHAGWLTVQSMPANEALAVGMEEMIRPATSAGRLIRPAIGVAIVGVLAWLCRGPKELPARDRLDHPRQLEFALVLLAMLLLSERTWKHHATTLPLVYLAVWRALTCIDWSARFRTPFVAGLAAQWIMLVAASEGLIGDDLAERLLHNGVFCWGLVLCFAQTAALLFALRRGRPPRPTLPA